MPLAAMKVGKMCSSSPESCTDVVEARTIDSARTPPAKMESQVIDWSKLQFSPSRTGARAMAFDAPTVTLDKFHCHVSTLNPGQNTGALHRHPQEELIVVKEGSLEVNIDGRKQTAGPGSMVFFSANENENMTNTGTVPATSTAMASSR